MANPGPDPSTVITPITQGNGDAYEARIKAYPSKGAIDKRLKE